MPSLSPTQSHTPFYNLPECFLGCFFLNIRNNFKIRLFLNLKGQDLLWRNVHPDNSSQEDCENK